MNERLAGRYVLLKRLGAGGMGEVFLARDLTTGTECALKRLKPGSARPASDLTRREFEALTRLRHPAVVAVHELGFAPDGTPYYTMEYVPGLPADRAIARGDWAALFFVAAQVAHGLEALHAAGVIHGDLKPSNLLVLTSPVAGQRPLGVRLLDFGLSAVLGRDDQRHRGTPGYAAPEIVHGDPPSPAADLYGFGAMLFTLVAGHPPFQAERPSAMLRRQQAGPPPAQPLEDVGAPPALVQLVLRMLAPDPAQRPSDAGEVRRELERIHPAARRPLAERLRSVVTVGRERELASLERWARSDESRTRVVIVTGDAGAGKSVLLGELASRAALDGRRVALLTGGAFSGAGAAALALIRRWAAEAEADTTAAPALHPATRAAIAEGGGTIAEADLGTLADAAAVWTAPATDGAARLVLLDDSERLDPLSRAFIRRLVLHPGAASLRWVMARRGGAAERVDGTPEDELVLREAGVAEVLALGALDVDAVARLAAARLNQQVPEALLSFIWSRAAGHAGLTVELLRAAAESGALRDSDAGLLVDAAVLEAVRTPVNFEASLMASYAALPEAARAAAASLAVWAIPVEPARVLALDPRATPDAIEVLVTAGLAGPDDVGRLSLTPPALGERVLESLADAGRRALHAAAAAWPDLPAAERFRHLSGAGEARAALDAAGTALDEGHDDRLAAAAAALADGAAPEQAARWHERAGRELAARGRYARAIPHLERALVSAAQDPGRFERWHRLSTCYLRVGRLADLEAVVREALDAGPTAAVRARLLSDEAARRGTLGDLDGARAAADEALALAREAGDDVVIGIAANTRARALLALGDHEAADAQALGAVEAYRRAGHGLGEVRAIGTRAAVAHARQQFKETEALYAQAIEAARQHGYRLVLEELMLGYCHVLIESGRWDAARAATAEAARIALEDERPTGAAYAFANLAQLDGLTGRSRSALQHGRAAVRLARAHLPDAEPYGWRSLAQAHRIAGRTARAERCARRALTMAMRISQPMQIDWARIELGRGWTAAGRWPEADELWDRTLDATAPSDSLGQTLLALLAGRAAIRRKDIAAATARLASAESWLAGHAAPYAAAVADQLRAEMALAQGKIKDAVDVARRALAALGALPAPPDRAQAQLELSRLALARNISDGRIPVGEWLDEAAATFERLGDRRSRERALALTVDWLRRTGGRGTVGARDRNLIESVSRLLNSLSDLKELTQRAMELAVEQFDAERGVLLLADPENGRLAAMAEHGAVDATTRRDAVTYSRRVVERVTQDGGSVLIADAPSDPRAASESVLDLRLRSIVCVPMYLGGRVVGAVYMDDSRRPDAFTDADRGLLEGFAHLMAVAIENSRGHEEVRRANEQLVGENLSLRQAAGARFQAHSLIGTSSAMQGVMSFIERAARTTSTVLIAGENGTGKELIARILHHSGKRRLRPFVAVNCGAIPRDLIESELFGIESGTATGVQGRDGKFVHADGGTLFLDEIGVMPLQQQVTLLSAIANREITRVGAHKVIPVDVRIIAATNSDLRRLVDEGTFREDLYYRLNVLPVEVPPLRDRKADIPSLAHHFVAHFAKQQERDVPELSPEFLAALMQSDWPGNVRELQNYIERVLAMNPGRTLRPNPPPRDLERRGTLRLGRPQRLNDLVEDLERRMLADALQKARGNQSVAARDLGMTEQSLRYRMKKHGLPSHRQILRVRRNLR